MTLQLINGDCIEQMKLLPDKSVDLFVCDLPYGQLHAASKQVAIGRESGFMGGCAWDVKIDLTAFWEQVERLAKNDNTPVLHFCNTRFGVELINSNPKWFRYDLVWNKERGVSFLSANRAPMKSHEMIYVFSKKGAYYNRIDVPTDKTEWKRGNRGDSISAHYGVDREHAAPNGGLNGMRCPLSVINVRTKKGMHPTEKPLELYKWLIERYSNPGDTILDPTAGSCNSVQAAQQLGRNGIGIEKDTGFYNAAVARLLPVTNEIISPPKEDAV